MGVYMIMSPSAFRSCGWMALCAKFCWDGAKFGWKAAELSLADWSSTLPMILGTPPPLPSAAFALEVIAFYSAVACAKPAADSFCLTSSFYASCNCCFLNSSGVAKMSRFMRLRCCGTGFADCLSKWMVLPGRSTKGQANITTYMKWKELRSISPTNLRLPAWLGLPLAG